MTCEELQNFIDSYLNDELLVETNVAVLGHLDACPACRMLIETERSLRNRVRLILKFDSQAQIDPAFRTRLDSELRASRSPSGVIGKIRNSLGRRQIFAGAAVCALLIAVFVIVGIRSRTSEPDFVEVISPIDLPKDTSSPEAVHAAYTTLASAAIDDHIKCSIDHQLTERPISLKQAAEKYAKFNDGIDTTVLTALKAKFDAKGDEKIELVDAHYCLYNGRRYTHIELQRRGQIVSVIVTDSDLPGTASGYAADVAGSKGFDASGFRVGGHAIFVISSFGADYNVAIARMIEPSVRKKLESASV